MASGRSGEVLRQFRTMFEVGAVAGLSDAELLERSTSRRGPAAELAFAALVERHGPMVLRVCRKALSDPHDAHDAFQSTFLVLARKADSIRDARSVASWLHGVALRVSAASRLAASRRRRHERKAAAGLPAAAGLAGPDDVASVLHEEIARLPGRYRAAVVLCYLEGKSHEEAAGHLECPVGTVKSRLAWARERLRDRLTIRGLAPAAGAIATVLSAESASAAVPLPAAWVESTATAALAFAARSLAGMAPGTVPAASAALAKGVMHAMLMNKIKVAAFAGAVVLGATGFGLVAQEPAGTPRNGSEPDRLQALEQKLDRLIQVLEGSAPRAATATRTGLSDVPVNVMLPSQPAVSVSNPPAGLSRGVAVNAPLPAASVSGAGAGLSPLPPATTAAPGVVLANPGTAPVATAAPALALPPAGATSAAAGPSSFIAAPSPSGGGRIVLATPGTAPTLTLAPSPAGAGGPFPPGVVPAPDRIQELEARLGRLEKRLERYEQRLSALEERRPEPRPSEPASTSERPGRP